MRKEIVTRMLDKFKTQDEKNYLEIYINTRKNYIINKESAYELGKKEIILNDLEIVIEYEIIKIMEIL